MRRFLHGVNVKILFALLALLPLFCLACGGGGGGGETGAGPAVLTVGGQLLAGVVAGAPVAGPLRQAGTYTPVASATLTLAGVQRTTDSNGYYRFDFPRAQADVLRTSAQQMMIQSSRTGSLQTPLRVGADGTLLVKIRVPLQSEGVASTTEAPERLERILDSLPPAADVSAVAVLVRDEIDLRETAAPDSIPGGISGRLAPASATLTLNGQSISEEAGRSPRLIRATTAEGETLYLLENVPVGQHRLRAVAEGYRPQEVSLTVYAGLIRAGVDLRLQSYNNSPDLVIQLVSGGNQEAAPGGVLPSPLVVRVTNLQGVLQSNVPVSFRSDHGGSVDTDTATAGNQDVAVTDADGRAFCLVARLGPVAGAQSFRASLSGVTSSYVSFQAMARSADMPTVNTVTSPTRVHVLQLTGTRPGPTSLILINGSDASVTYPTDTGWAASITLTEGSNLIAVAARSQTGSVSPAVQVTVVLDTTAPEAPVLTSNPSPVKEEQITVTGTKTSDATSVRINGSATGVFITSDTSWSAQLNLAAGNNVFRLTALDALGNESQATSVTIVRDVVGAEGTLALASDGNFTNQQVVTLSLTSTDAAAMQFSLDGHAWTAWELFAGSRSGFDLGSGDGARTIYARFRDSLGNEGAVVSLNVTLDTVAPEGTVSILEGSVVNSTLVTLVLASTDSSSVRFSLDNANWSEWEVWQAQRTGFDLGRGDGLRTVYVQFRDAAGNLSSVVADSVTVDRSGPSGTIRVGDGSPSVASALVTLNLSASDAAEMRFSLDALSWSAWEDYASQKSGFDLGSGDGLKAVFVQFRDALSNVGAPAGAGVLLDTTGPTGTMSVGGGAASTRELQVPLSISSSDAVEMRFSADGSNWTDWQPFLTTLENYLLAPGDGQKTVYLQLRDTLGNIGATIQDSILLDTEGPTGTVVINGGASFTTNRQTVLTLSSADAVSMRFSADGSNWSAWETYAVTRSDWDLGAVDGERVVYAQFQDEAGNAGTPAVDTIRLDTTGADGTVQLAGGAIYTNSQQVTLTLTSADAAEMRFSLDNQNWSDWEPFATSKAGFDLGSGDGVKTVYAQFRDSQQITGAVVTASPVLDTVAPTLNLSAPSLALTNSGPVTFQVTYSGADAVTLSAGDVSLVTTGTVSADFTVTGNGAASQTITVSGISGDGSLSVQLVAGTARDAAGNLAAAATSVSFAVDNTAPAIAVATPTPEHVNVGPASFVVQFTDCSQVTFSSGHIGLLTTGTATGNVTVSGSGLLTRTVTISECSGDGTLALVIAAGSGTDAAGNPTSAITSPVLNVDNTKPVVSVTAALSVGGDARVNFAEFSAGFSVVARSGEAAGTLFLVPAGTQDDLSSIILNIVAQTGVNAADTDLTIAVPAYQAGITDGTSYIVYAMDAAENVSAPSAIAFIADFTAPAVTLNVSASAGGDGWISLAEKAAGFTVTAVSDAPSGFLYLVPAGTAEDLASIEAAALATAPSAGAGLDTILSVPAASAALTDGTIYRVYASDQAGNLSPASVDVLTADLTPPTVILNEQLSSGGDAWVNIAEHAAGFTVVAASSDAMGTLYVVPSTTAAVQADIVAASVGHAASAGAGVDTTVTVSGNQTAVADGIVFVVYALDAAGNPSTIPATAFTVDRVAPVLAISAPSTTSTNSGPVTYTLSYTGADSISLDAGTHVTFSASVGVTATAAVSTVDASTRTLTLSAIGGEGTLQPLIAADTARDLAGNVAAGGSGDLFTVDKTAPTVTVVTAGTSGGDAWVNIAEKAAGFVVCVRSNEDNGRVYVVPSGTAADLGAITLAQIGSQTVATPAGSDTTIAIAAGSPGVDDGLSFVVYAVDDAGNISLASLSAFVVDLQTPAVVVVNLQTDAAVSPIEDRMFGLAGTVLEPDITLKAYVWTDTNLDAQIDPGELGAPQNLGQSSGDGSLAPANIGALADGTYSFIIEAIDPAGNSTGQLTANKAIFTIDSTSLPRLDTILSGYNVIRHGWYHTNGLIYVAVSGLNTVKVLNQAGVDQGVVFSGATFNNPSGVTVSGSQIFVADSGNHRILIFDMSGNYVGGWGSFGTGTGQFNFPVDIAAGPSGNVYVADMNNHRIVKFAPDGSSPLTLGGTASGTAIGQFNTPSGIAVDAAEQVYVADTFNHRVQVFDQFLNGATGVQFGGSGTGDGQFNSPRGVVIDAASNIWVVDTNNIRVQKFAPDRSFLLKYGYVAAGEYNMSQAWGIIVDVRGYGYLLDTALNRIKIYRP